MQERKKFACHCCGFLTLTEEPLGSYEICPVCFWEDDYVQLMEPTVGGGPNHVSLEEARQNYAKFGVSEERFKMYVRPPNPDEYPS
jgi:hypothetical protein